MIYDPYKTYCVGAMTHNLVTADEVMARVYSDLISLKIDEDWTDDPLMAKVQEIQAAIKEARKLCDFELARPTRNDR